MIDVIILAGGMGTRLRSVVSDVPKPLAPVNGRPFLDLILKQLDAFRSVRKVVLALGYRADQVKARYIDNSEFSFDIEYSVESSPLGTGGALFQALPLTQSTDVLVMNGDSYVDFDLAALIKLHMNTGAAISMVVVSVEDTARYGSVLIDTANGRVLGFAEKSGSRGRGFINAGCYLLSRRAFEGVPLGPSSFEKDFLPGHLTSAYAQIATGKFIDIGIPESYSRAGDYFRE